MDSKIHHNNSLVPIKSDSLIRVEHSFEVTDKILYNGIEPLFNEAFYLINNNNKGLVYENFCYLIEYDPKYLIRKNFGFEAKSRNDYIKAIELFQQLIGIKSNFKFAHNYYGLTKTFLGNYKSQESGFPSSFGDNLTKIKSNIDYYQEIINDFDKAIEIDPLYPNPYNNRAIVKMILIKELTSFEFWSKVNENKPNYEEVCNTNRKNKTNPKNYQGSIDDFTKAINCDPSFANAYHNRAITKDKYKDLEGAISDYSKAIEINPDHVYAYNNRGVDKALLNDYEGAIDDYSRAIEIDPYYYYSFHNRGSAKVEIKDLKGAESDFKKAEYIYPIYYHPNLTDDENKIYALMLYEYTNPGINFSIYEHCAHLQLEKHAYCEAVKFFDKAIELDPTCLRTIESRAETKIKLGDYLGAIDDYTKAIEIKPTDLDLYEIRGNLFVELGKKHSAEKDFKKADELRDANRSNF